MPWPHDDGIVTPACAAAASKVVPGVHSTCRWLRANSTKYVCPADDEGPDAGGGAGAGASERQDLIAGSAAGRAMKASSWYRPGGTPRAVTICRTASR